MTNLKRRDFLKAAAVTGGVTVVAAGAVRSFIPEARAGEPLAATFDKVPVVKGNFAMYPPPEKWNGWRELSGDDWKRGGIARTDVKVHEHVLVPTICNNCEAACGLTAWVDKETMVVRKYMGNPFHTGSVGLRQGLRRAVADVRPGPHSVSLEARAGEQTWRGQVGAHHVGRSAHHDWREDERRAETWRRVLEEEHHAPRGAAQ